MNPAFNFKSGGTKDTPLYYGKETPLIPLSTHTEFNAKSDQEAITYSSAIPISPMMGFFILTSLFLFVAVVRLLQKHRTRYSLPFSA